jgi:Indoleamine 2,3-dioxygenase
VRIGYLASKRIEQGRQRGPAFIMAAIGHQPHEAQTSTSSSSHIPRRLRTTRYPQWPKQDEEAEYHEIPPEHFLAHIGPSKSQFSLTSNGNDAATADISVSVDVFDPWAAETHNLAFEEMPDTSTLAAADFDVDVRTGFLPPEPPLERLTDEPYVPWETILADANQSHLTLGADGPQEHSARRWRRCVREVSPYHAALSLRGLN